MSAAKQFESLEQVELNPQVLLDYLKPTVDSLIRPQTGVIKATLQLQDDHDNRARRGSNIIKLFDRPSNSPTINDSYPVCYQRQQIALLHLTQKQSVTACLDKHNAAFTPTEKLLKALSLLLKRYQASALINQCLGKELSISGHSEQALKLDSFVEKASNANCPVIITGEQGSEQLSVACAIHYSSKRKQQPFVEFNCISRNNHHFETKLQQCLRQANSGTIFINAIDKLTSEQQAMLTDLLATSSSTVANELSNSQLNNRLIVATSQPLSQLVTDKLFSKPLFDKLNYLNITIPSISQRKEDIPHIVQRLQRQYQLFPEQEFATEAKQALYNYHWPNNYQELEQTIARLMTLASSNPIGISDIQLLAPEVLTPVSYGYDKANSIDLINCLKSNNFECFEHVHKGLRKALIFIAENYLNPISLGYLSEQVHISPSHLSYLFKQHMGKTIKQIITELRIAKAKELIEQSPNCLITNVALDVGFGDLSHFEKMFKRYTKLTPREYKTQVKQNLLALV